MLPRLVRISQEKFDALETKDFNTFYFVLKPNVNRGSFYIGDYLIGEVSGITDNYLTIKFNGNIIGTFNGSEPVEINVTPNSIGAQEKLVSGVNIKTINNISLLGSGNIPIEGGEGNDFFMRQRFNNTTSVVIEHNSGKIPSITIFDTSGSEIFASYQNVNESTIEILFSRPISGIVYLN